MSFLEQFAPEVLRSVLLGGLPLWQWLVLPLIFSGIFLVALVVSSFVARAFTGVVTRTTARWDDQLLATLRRPLSAFLGLVAASLALGALRLPQAGRETLEQILQTLLLIVGAFVLMRFVDFLADTLRHSFANAEGDELRLRGMRTQIIVIRRVSKIFLAIVCAALVLIQFEFVRKVGVSLLASAGVAGLVIGLAAQRSIASILAGIQLAVTQPIRIGDTVIVEGEYGTIEEINLTYVVVQVWDLRRLVVPISRFLEQPFQNWTKVAPELLGSVFLHADYSVPVQSLREQLLEYVRTHAKWDGRSATLVVTDAAQSTIQLRAVVSAADAGSLWDLRCDVREHLVGYLRDLEGGRFLPKQRWARDSERP